MGKKGSEAEPTRTILPRKPIEQLEREAAEGLDALYTRVSSEEALRAENELRATLSPLAIAVLNADFVLEEISPIVVDALRRRGINEVPLSKGKFWRPSIAGVDYVIDYSHSSGTIAVEGWSLDVDKKRGSVADHMQEKWDLASNSSIRRGLVKFSQLRQADLVNIFRGARPV